MVVSGPSGPGGKFFVYRPGEHAIDRVVRYTDYRALIDDKMRQGGIWHLFGNTVKLSGTKQEMVEPKTLRIELGLTLLVNEVKTEWNEDNLFLKQEGAKRLYQALLNCVPEVAQEVKLIEHKGEPALLLLF